MIKNLSCYKFVTLNDLLELRTKLKQDCLKFGVKGTILLAPEGINLFIAGDEQAISSFKQMMWAIPEFSDLDFKESVSGGVPFTRMLVKLKKEIITLGRPDINPAKKTGKRLTAEEFKQWMDEGRDLIVLDTRNDYEVRIGTFKNAIDLNLNTFRQFPERIAQLPSEMRKKPVISFCTGGIRCEKASALLESEGFEEVYQLDGGILRYFEKVGGAHYNGECFVFDHRVSVDPALNETDSVLCYACQSPVTGAEQKTPAYVPNQSCPHCINGRPATVLHKERIAAEIKARAATAHSGLES